MSKTGVNMHVYHCSERGASAEGLGFVRSALVADEPPNERSLNPHYYGGTHTPDAYPVEDDTID